MTSNNWKQGFILQRKFIILSPGILITALALVLLAVGCSTRKNTMTRRAFHNLTAHYNAYFNGEQALKQGVNQIRDAHVDNYEEILPVFRLADEAASIAAGPDFDRAIKKSAKVVQKHSMEFNGTEYNNWIDDAYLLMGKAQFYKQEYLLSKRLFNFVMSKYRNHDQVYNAMIWKARVDVLRGNYEQALNSLEEVHFYDRRGRVSKKSKRLYTRVLAQLYIETGNHSKAIQWLDQAIKVNNKKDIVTRLMFIKAQVLLADGQKELATKAFRKVIDKNPSYDLTFYSKINIAKSYQKGQNSDYDIKEELQEMLKDAKNKEYKDVIYYALSQIALQENDMAARIEYLQKSVSKSLNNNRQKAVSALELGDVYFDRKQYELSQNYYDSAMNVLPKKFPDADSLKMRHDVLSALVDNLMNIERQDSLQRIAAMPQAERETFILDLIQQIKEDERKQREEEQRRLNAMREAEMDRARQQQTVGKGEWYFYNNQSKSFGFTEFQKRWGERKLEDNWRLSNKASMSFAGDGSDPLDQMIRDSLSKEGFTAKDVGYYLADLPLTDSLMAVSDSIIKQSLFDLGLIYQEDLKNYSKAVDTYEELTQRFPQSKYTLRAYYHLYQNYQKLGDTAQANQWKSRILNEYADSDYAKIIQNPDYFKKQEKQLNAEEAFYKEAWTAYQNQQYSQVITLADTGISKYGDDEVASRLALLRAFAKGHVADSSAYTDALRYVTVNYRKTPSANAAQQILDYLEPEKSDGKLTQKDKEDSQTTESYYKYQPESMQLYIAVFDVKGLKVNELKGDYSDFNKESASLENLSVNSVYLDSRRQMLTISRFDNAAAALKYYKTVQASERLKKYFDQQQGKHFILSVNDYSRFYKKKKTDEYLKFFEKNYLKR